MAGSRAEGRESLDLKPQNSADALCIPEASVPVVQKPEGKGAKWSSSESPGSLPLVPLDFTFQCLPRLRFFFFKGFRWLVSKQLLRMGAIEVDGCEAGRMDAERLWQS